MRTRTLTLVLATLAVSGLMPTLPSSIRLHAVAWAQAGDEAEARRREEEFLAASRKMGESQRRFAEFYLPKPEELAIEGGKGGGAPLEWKLAWQLPESFPLANGMMSQNDYFVKESAWWASPFVAFGTGHNELLWQLREKHGRPPYDPRAKREVLEKLLAESLQELQQRHDENVQLGRSQGAKADSLAELAARAPTPRDALNRFWESTSQGGLASYWAKASVQWFWKQSDDSRYDWGPMQMVPASTISDERMKELLLQQAFDPVEGVALSYLYCNDWEGRARALAAALESENYHPEFYGKIRQDFVFAQLTIRLRVAAPNDVAELAKYDLTRAGAEDLRANLQKCLDESIADPREVIARKIPSLIKDVAIHDGPDYDGPTFARARKAYRERLARWQDHVASLDEAAGGPKVQVALQDSPVNSYLVVMPVYKVDAAFSELERWPMCPYGAGLRQGAAVVEIKISGEKRSGGRLPDDVIARQLQHCLKVMEQKTKPFSVVKPASNRAKPPKTPRAGSPPA